MKGNLMDDAKLVEVVDGGEHVLHPHARHGQRHRRLLLEQAVDIDEPPFHNQHCPSKEARWIIRVRWAGGSEMAQSRKGLKQLDD